jgi:hypothetical protein
MQTRGGKPQHLTSIKSDIILMHQKLWRNYIMHACMHACRLDSPKVHLKELGVQDIPTPSTPPFGR